MKKALALSALAVLGAASVAPAMAGPYVTTKVGIKGEDSEMDKNYVETRIGYETKVVTSNLTLKLVLPGKPRMMKTPLLLSNLKLVLKLN